MCENYNSLIEGRKAFGVLNSTISRAYILFEIMIQGYGTIQFNVKIICDILCIKEPSAQCCKCHRFIDKARFYSIGLFTSNLTWLPLEEAT